MCSSEAKLRRALGAARRNLFPDIPEDFIYSLLLKPFDTFRNFLSLVQALASFSNLVKPCEAFLSLSKPFESFASLIKVRSLYKLSEIF